MRAQSMTRCRCHVGNFTMNYKLTVLAIVVLVNLTQAKLIQESNEDDMKWNEESVEPIFPNSIITKEISETAGVFSQLIRNVINLNPEEITKLIKLFGLFSGELKESPPNDFEVNYCVNITNDLVSLELDGLKFYQIASNVTTDFVTFLTDLQVCAVDPWYKELQCYVQCGHFATNALKNYSNKLKDIISALKSDLKQLKEDLYVCFH